MNSSVLNGNHQGSGQGVGALGLSMGTLFPLFCSGLRIKTVSFKFRHPSLAGPIDQKRQNLQKAQMLKSAIFKENIKNDENVKSGF